jgi:hypothetical protein
MYEAYHVPEDSDPQWVYIVIFMFGNQENEIF